MPSIYRCICTYWGITYLIVFMYLKVLWYIHRPDESEHALPVHVDDCMYTSVECMGTPGGAPGPCDGEDSPLGE